MRRNGTTFSPIALVLLGAMSASLVLLFWRQGGLAFSPGDLSADGKIGHSLGGFPSHAEFAKECNLCHRPLKTNQADLCVDCHKNIAEEISAKTGTHGRIEAVDRCARCHSDHKGKEFDMVAGSLKAFDHSKTSFSLVWHQVDFDASIMECSRCHSDSEDFSVSSQDCAGCHRKDNQDFMDQHIEDFGLRCLECHDGSDRFTDFDHRETVFPLMGEHANVRCGVCHVDGQLQGTPTDCASCHAEPELHQGLFQTDCATCHDPGSWKSASLDGKTFDHLKNADFSLALHTQDYAGNPVNCKGCHTKDIHTIDLKTCRSCHANHDSDFRSKHIGQFGRACLDCHDGVDRLSNFDHQTFFPLQGKHADLECVSCHSDQVYRGTPKACVQCHAEPEIHAGYFGLQCQDCHDAKAWAPAELRIHLFPLNHGSDSELACQICHLQAYTQYTCYGCHDHQESDTIESHTHAGIKIEALPDCAKCHPDGNVQSLLGVRP